MAFQVTEVQRVLKGADYPMDGTALAALAKKNGAPDDLVGALKGLRKVDGPNAVMSQLKAELGGPTPGGGTSREREYKSVEQPAYQVNEVQKYLKGADYPMDGSDLAALARRNGAPDDLVQTLKGVRRVDGPNAVMQEIREHLGGRPG